MNRLGWVRAADDSLAQWDRLTALVAAARAEGLDRTLVCGMGGSSLTAHVLASAAGAPSLQVLDSTDPAAVSAAVRAGDTPRTLYLVVSKSGTTAETLAFYHYFATGARPGQFVAITDRGSPLETLGRAKGFRAVLEHPADVGGRYAALTAVGMLPAALMGIDGRTLLERARRADVARARALGVTLADAAARGRDKLLLRPPQPVAALAPWIEQLVAESAGKDGRGIVPVVDDPGDVRLADAQVVTEFAADPMDLGAEFLRWEHVTHALCERLGVNPFDQPDVDEAKRLAREEVAAGTGTAPRGTLTLAELSRRAAPGDYFALLAYLPPFPEIAARLQGVRAAWGRALGVATTLGFGPRYLHSTGQLHKGGPNRGLFLVVTADPPADVAIPEIGGTFGALQRAQAHGDIRALLARGRRVAHVHLARPDDFEALAPPPAR